MDATKRPLIIPPEFALYAEKHDIFDLYKNLLQLLIINKPSDPIKYLIDTLKKENHDVPAVVVLGPPASGKHTIGKMLAGRLRCPHLTMKNIAQDANRELKSQVEYLLREQQPIPTSLWVKLIQHRLSVFDVNKKGYVLSAFPQTREQAKALQTEGILPTHVVILDCDDTVLIERAVGKRIDPENGDIYHLTFDPPTEEEVENRLEEVPGNDEAELTARLLTFRREIDNILPCYHNCIKSINADQPLADVFSTAVEFCRSSSRSAAPRNPRILLLGPSGCGRRTQAALISNKYNIVNIDCSILIRRAVVDETKLGLAMKSYVEKKFMVPDALLMKLLSERLSQMDCVTRGWVMHGYPRTREQGEQLSSAGFEPNRIFFFDISIQSAIERLTNRVLDPVTGERYHNIYNPAHNNNVTERLIQHPDDVLENVQRRMTRYNTHIEELKEFYWSAQLISADQDIHTVFEALESGIVNPVPKKLS